MLKALFFLLLDQQGVGKVFSDIYTEAARDTGDTTTTHITYVKKKVNDALREISSLMAFSWLKRTATFAPVAGTQAYTISAIAADWDVDTPVSIWYRETSNQPVELDAYDDEEWKEQEDTDQGTPYGFNISKKSGDWKLYLALVPDSAFVSSYPTLNFDYSKYVTELSAVGDIPELPAAYHQALVYWTNKLICAEMGDDNGFAKWEKLAEETLGRLKSRQIHRLGRPKRAYPRSYLGTRGGGGARDYR